MLSNILETLGLALIAAAAWSVAVPVGLFTTGAFLVIVGMAADRSGK